MVNDGVYNMATLKGMIVTGAAIANLYENKCTIIPERRIERSEKETIYFKEERR